MDSDGHKARLALADWTIDAAAVVSACEAADPDRVAALRIVVPAWLHGLDWVGDPRASLPCARRQVDRIAQLCAAIGLHVESLEVGDPDPLSAIGDALADHPVDEIVVFARGRHVAGAYPLSVVRRAERLTGLPVRGVAAPRAASRSRRPFRFGAHCEAAVPRVA